MPASKKAIAKKVVAPISSYMRKRKQERHIRSFLNPVRAEQNKRNTKRHNPPTHPETITLFPLYPHPASRLPSFSTSLVPCNYHAIFLIISSPPKKVTSPLNTSPPIKLTSPLLKLPPRGGKKCQKEWGGR